MVGPQGKRRAVEYLLDRRGTSERHACRLVRQPRSTQRYQGRTPAEERTLVVRMLALSQRHPRYGYRRVWAMLRGEGWRVNRKRVHRLWRQEGLKVPLKARKQRALGHSGNSCQRYRAQRKNQVWSYDFVHDKTEDHRGLKFLAVVDEYTRECLALEVARYMSGEEVAVVLERIVAERGTPEHLRSDNGAEFIATKVKRWLAQARIATLYIEPGSPWENAYSETFNSRMRDEFLNRELFTSLAEAQLLAAEYRQEYNHRRPHSALHYRTPADFAAQAPSGSVRPASPSELRLREPARYTTETLISSGT